MRRRVERDARLYRSEGGVAKAWRMRSPKTATRHSHPPRRGFAIAVIALLMLFAAGTAQDASADVDTFTVNVYYFWGDGCPVCVQQAAFLDALVERYPEVQVHAFEVWRATENRALLEAMSAAFGRPVTAVPVTFIGEDSWVGFNQVAGRQMTASVEMYRTYDAPDPADRLPAELRDALLPEPPTEE